MNLADAQSFLIAPLLLFLTFMKFGYFMQVFLQNWTKATTISSSNRKPFPVFNTCTSIKFIYYRYSEKTTKFCEISTLLLTTVHTVKSKVEISQNFVAFSEYMNFILNFCLSLKSCNIQVNTTSRALCTVAPPQSTFVQFRMQCCVASINCSLSQLTFNPHKMSFWGVGLHEFYHHSYILSCINFHIK